LQFFPDRSETHIGFAPVKELKDSFSAA
jgi:hypothetical protein